MQFSLFCRAQNLKLQICLRGLYNMSTHDILSPGTSHRISKNFQKNRKKTFTWEKWENTFRRATEENPSSRIPPPLTVGSNLRVNLGNGKVMGRVFTPRLQTGIADSSQCCVLPLSLSLSLLHVPPITPHHWLPSHWKCGRLCFDRRVFLFIYLYACYSHNTKSIKPNRMKFGGMIVYYPRTIWIDCGIDRVKGQGHDKVKIFFLP